MFKKLSIVAAVVAVLVLVAVLVFKWIAGPGDGARLVPSDALLYVSLNDLPRSVLRWQGTALAEIAREPEVRAFLEKPLAKMTASEGAGEAGGILAGLKPGRIFLAVTGVEEAGIDAVVGFQFWGGKADFDHAVGRLRQELPPGTSKTEQYGEVEIVSTDHGRFTLFSAACGRWGFLATDPALIRSLVDRAAGKNPGPVLADSAEFIESRARMLPSPDLSFFLRPGKWLDLLLSAGRQLGAEAIPSQVEDLRSITAVAVSWKLDGALQRDAVFLMRPGMNPVEPLSYKSRRFTGPDSVLYADFLVRLAGLPAILERVLPPERKDAALDLAGIASEAFGPEGSVVADWSNGQMTPAAILALQVQDPERAEEAVRRFLTFFPEATVTEQNGIRLYSLPSVSNPLASPTLALSGDFLIAGLDAGAVVRAASASGPSIETLPSFAPALKASGSANEAFLFFDTRSVFERAYNALRPVILFSAQVMPGLGGVVDTSKLPQTDTVAKHLPPVILSQRRVDGGVLIESSGPLTVSQIAIGAAAGAATAAPPRP